MGGLKGRDSYVYNTIKGSLISLNKLEPDSMSLFLPIVDNEQAPNFRNGTFCYFDGTFFYNNYSSLKMFDFKDENPNKIEVYNPIMKEYFKKQNRESNPVIIQLEPKD